MKILKNILFWLWTIVGNCVMNIIGAVVALVFICMGYKPKTYFHGVYFVKKGNGGGINLGNFFFVCEDVSYYTEHEYGHALEGVLLGPIMPILGLISLVRCGYFNTHKTKAEYDDWGFEGCATYLGSINAEKYKRGVSKNK